MTSILGRIFGISGRDKRHPTRGDRTYAMAMAASNDLIRHLRDHPESRDAARSVVADIWKMAHNAPFMTTVFQAVQEAKSGPEQLNGTVRKVRR